MSQQQQPAAIMCGDLSADVPAMKFTPEGRVCWDTRKDSVSLLWLSAPRGQTWPFLIDPDNVQTVAFSVSREKALTGDYEICGLLVIPPADNGRYTVLLVDSITKRQYMNVPTFFTFVCGLPNFPAAMAASIYVPATTALEVTVQSFIGGPASIALEAFGRRFVGQESINVEARRRAAFMSRRLTPYWLGADLGPQVLCPAGATIDVRMTVPTGAHFLGIYFMDDSDGAYNVQVFLGTNMNSLNDRPVSRDVMFVRPAAGITAIGAASLRRCLWSQAVEPNTPLTFRVTDTSGAPNQIRLCVHGLLAYADEDRGMPTAPETLSLPVQPGPFALPAAQGTCAPCDAPSQAGPWQAMGPSAAPPVQAAPAPVPQGVPNAYQLGVRPPLRGPGPGWVPVGLPGQPLPAPRHDGVLPW